MNKAACLLNVLYRAVPNCVPIGTEAAIFEYVLFARSANEPSPGTKRRDTVRRQRKSPSNDITLLTTNSQARQRTTLFGAFTFHFSPLMSPSPPLQPQTLPRSVDGPTAVDSDSLAVDETTLIRICQKGDSRRDIVW